jgi:NADH-quinone oxidoreductase subunit J
MSVEVVRGLFFYLFAALIIGGALVVAFARNIVHSAFALLGTFAGMAALYAFLSADLVAVIQLMVYVGGVLILILFAVMLTARIEETDVSNPTVGRVPGLLALAAVAVLMVFTGFTVFGSRGRPAPEEPTVARIGDALLGRYVLPFEVISVLLLAALLGAVTIAGGRLRKRESEGREEGTR